MVSGSRALNLAAAGIGGHQYHTTKLGYLHILLINKDFYIVTEI